MAVASTQTSANKHGAADLRRLSKAILRLSKAPRFKSDLKETLLKLCRVNTTPNADINAMRAAEAQCFDILEQELGTLDSNRPSVERRPVNAAIQNHENYSLLHFTKTARRPEGLSAEEAYAKRSNLICRFTGSGQGPGRSVALNAHVDVVAPYFPPIAKGDVIYGRGACDDKGPVMSLVSAFKLLTEAMRKEGLTLNRDVLGMFVIEEETGGNGSLSLAMDRELRKLYDSILVCECTNLKVHPANRGAVWYKAEISRPRGGSLLEMASFVIGELEKEGASIRSESRHDLFPQRPVQTCHGIIGPFGEHPSRICGRVSFTIKLGKKISERAETLIRDCLEHGLTSYVALYGDKSKVNDPSTGKPMVARHYSIVPKSNSLVVEVFGATGHMGAIRERDGAITKMAQMIRSLVYSRGKIEALAGKMELQLNGAPDGKLLVLEGGQGFVPTHTIREVMSRLATSAELGARSYLARRGLKSSEHRVVKMTYEKLHNVAFDGDPKSASMRNAIEAAKECGIWKDEPVLGWTVSCDARLFATEYPGLEVLTFGPGELAHAHSDQEQVRMEDLVRGAEFLALFIARQAGVSRSPN